MKRIISTSISILTVLMAISGIREVNADCKSLHKIVEEAEKRANHFAEIYYNRARSLGAGGFSTNAPGQAEAYSQWDTHFTVWYNNNEEYKREKCLPVLMAPRKLPAPR